MNYYNRHIGDYAKKTGRLSMLEHGAYTLLLDAYYDRERPPTKQEAVEWCWARNDEEIAAVEFLLGRFFRLDGEVYRQKRIDEEIYRYREKSNTNKRIAQEREEKRRQERERTVHEPCTDGHLTNNQEPITNNQKPEEKKKETSRISDENAVEDFYLTKKKKKLSGKRLETFLRFWTAFNLKLGKADAADAWLDIPALTEKLVSSIVTGAEKEAEARPQLVAAGKTPKWAQGWLAGRRWEDEAVAVSAPLPQEDKKCAGCGILVEFGCNGKTAESRACASYEVAK